MGAYFCMGAYKCDVVVVIKMNAYIHGSYFVWVLIIPILRYIHKFKNHSPVRLSDSVSRYLFSTVWKRSDDCTFLQTLPPQTAPPWSCSSSSALEWWSAPSAHSNRGVHTSSTGGSSSAGWVSVDGWGVSVLPLWVKCCVLCGTSVLFSNVLKPLHRLVLGTTKGKAVRINRFTKIHRNLFEREPSLYFWCNFLYRVKSALTLERASFGLFSCSRRSTDSSSMHTFVSEPNKKIRTLCVSYTSSKVINKVALCRWT